MKRHRGLSSANQSFTPSLSTPTPLSLIDLDGIHQLPVYERQLMEETLRQSLSSSLLFAIGSSGKILRALHSGASQPSRQSTGWQSLPQDLLLFITRGSARGIGSGGFLTTSDLFKLEKTCRQWHRILVNLGWGYQAFSNLFHADINRLESDWIAISGRLRGIDKFLHTIDLMSLNTGFTLHDLVNAVKHCTAVVHLAVTLSLHCTVGAHQQEDCDGKCVYVRNHILHEQDIAMDLWESTFHEHLPSLRTLKLQIYGEEVEVHHNTCQPDDDATTQDVAARIVVYFPKVTDLTVVAHDLTRGIVACRSLERLTTSQPEDDGDGTTRVELCREYRVPVVPAAIHPNDGDELKLHDLHSLVRLVKTSPLGLIHLDINHAFPLLECDYEYEVINVDIGGSHDHWDAYSYPALSTLKCHSFFHSSPHHPNDPLLPIRHLPRLHDLSVVPNGDATSQIHETISLMTKSCPQVRTLKLKVCDSRPYGPKNQDWAWLATLTKQLPTLTGLDLSPCTRHVDYWPCGLIPLDLGSSDMLRLNIEYGPVFKCHDTR